MLVDTDHLLAIGEAATKGISRLAADAESGHDYVLLRNSRPVAAVVGMDRLERLQELEAVEDDLRLLALALARFITDTGGRTSFEDVLDRFGLTEGDLDAADAAEEAGEDLPTSGSDAAAQAARDSRPRAVQRRRKRVS